VLNGLVADTARTTIVDLEAGLEHLSRGTARHVDTLLIIGEPYFKSLETASRSFALARDLGIARISMIANKIRTPRDEAAVRDFAGRRDCRWLVWCPTTTPSSPPTSAVRRSSNIGPTRPA
jgi:CO dehydrogenase maturation factor